MRKRVGARVDQLITEKRANGGEIDLMGIVGQVCEEIIPLSEGEINTKKTGGMKMMK
jgi:hypothetical protein